MKFQEFIKNKKGIEQWLNEMYIGNYTINPDLSVDVDDNVILYDRNLKSLPIQFRNVTGDFVCSHNELVTLKGSPILCGSFDCMCNDLETLKYLPREIEGDLWVNENLLTTFDYVPKDINIENFVYLNNNFSYKTIEIFLTRNFPYQDGKLLYKIYQNENFMKTLGITRKFFDNFFPHISNAHDMDLL